jgi:uncharacterized protein YabN with tetrapyrrole methylase and pyrophosphatase domain
MNQGRLIISGTGLELGHVTTVTKGYIEQSDQVLYLVADPVTERWIKRLSASAESLQDCYAENKDRLQSYDEMVERILEKLRLNLEVCVLFYGHPGVFVNPSHRAIARAREEGFEAVMLPGISAEDCLFADLGVDPSLTGCQSFEATDFLVFKRNVDARSALILWQIGVIGNLNFNLETRNGGSINLLVEYLQGFYPSSHQVVVYEAAQYALCKPVIQHVSLAQLENAPINAISTLYIPPSEPSLPDEEMLARLGIVKSVLRKG